MIKFKTNSFNSSKESRFCDNSTYNYACTRFEYFQSKFSQIKSLHILVLSLLLLIIANNKLFSQNTYFVGSETELNTSAYPIMLSTGASHCSRTSQIYTKEQLNATNPSFTGGSISAIGWQAGGNFMISGHLKIYMKHSENNSINSTEQWETDLLSGVVEVYNQQVTYNTADESYFIVNLQSAFNWNGTDNLLVLVEFNRIGGSFFAQWRMHRPLPWLVQRQGYNQHGTVCPVAQTSLRDRITNTVFIAGESTPMSVQSISGSQITINAQPNSSHEEILKFEIIAAGSIGNLVLNSLQVTSTNTNNSDVIQNGVKLWTGDNFITATQLSDGETFVNNKVTFSDISFNLGTGINTFWITYDIASNAQLNNILDAFIAIGDIVISANGGAIVPDILPLTTINPSGHRKIGYCNQLYSSPNSLYYIDNVTINNVQLHTSGTGLTGGQGYVDYTSVIVNLNANSNVIFSITGDEYSTGNYLGIWIDFNTNIRFDDANEFVGFSQSQQGGNLQGQITIPSNIQTGFYRMRIRVASNNVQSLFTSCTEYAFGEAHDYTVFITSSGTEECVTPTIQTGNIQANQITPNTAQLSWTNGNGNGRVLYINTMNSFSPPANGENPVANNHYSGLSQQCVYNGFAQNNVLVTGLQPNTSYYVRAYEYCLPERKYAIQTHIQNPIQFTTPTETFVLNNNLLSPVILIDQNELTIFNVEQLDITVFEVYNISGSIVYKTENKVNDYLSLPAGMYFYILKTHSQQYSGKVIIFPN